VSGGPRDRDAELQKAVRKELEWDPQVDAAHIGVSAEDGVVTLTGHVASYAERIAALHAAERVHGVRVVADDIIVRPAFTASIDDTDLAEEIMRRFRWNIIIPEDVTVEVREGTVTLRGEVRWPFQRKAAERAVRDVRGVREVDNLITIKPREKPKAEEVERRIADGIARMADLEARRIWVETTDGAVHLHGTVHSLHEKRLAEEAALSAAGVMKIENDLVVVP
jgi:osmotically-inducible protein OsmY